MNHGDTKEEEKLSQAAKLGVPLGVSVLFFVAYALVLYYSPLFERSIEEKSFVDLFGPLGALFSGLAFAAVAYNLWQVQKESDRKALNEAFFPIYDRWQKLQDNLQSSGGFVATYNDLPIVAVRYNRSKKKPEPTNPVEDEAKAAEEFGRGFSRHRHDLRRYCSLLNQLFDLVRDQPDPENHRLAKLLRFSASEEAYIFLYFHIKLDLDKCEDSHFLRHAKQVEFFRDFSLIRLPSNSGARKNYWYLLSPKGNDNCDPDLRPDQASVRGAAAV